MGNAVKQLRPICLVGLLLLLSACETAFRTTEQEIRIQTEPSGATVELSDGQHCTSPCQLTAARDLPLTVSIAKTGCRTAAARITPGVIDPDEPEAFLLRSVYDYQLGGAYELRPEPLSVTLLCGADARQPAIALTAEDEALIEQFGRRVTTWEQRPLIPIH